MGDESKEKVSSENRTGKKPVFERKSKKTKALLLTSAIVMLFIIGVAVAYDYGYSMCKSHEQPIVKIEKPMIILSGRAPQIVIPKGFNYSFYVKTGFGAIGVFSNDKNTMLKMMQTRGAVMNSTADWMRVKVVLPPVYNYSLINGTNITMNNNKLFVEFNKNDLYRDVVLKANGTWVKIEVIKNVPIGNTTKN